MAVEGFADGCHAAVHHVAGRDAVGAGLGVSQGCGRQFLHAGIVVHVIAFGD